jgi:GAF domain-containing protein
MLARGHRLRIGEVGIVGTTTQTGRPYISSDVGRDSAHFAHEFLPETRSEMALPLVVGDTIIGALDVQSKNADAFDQEDVEILQILTDQLAIAIQNSQLISEIQETVSELQAAYGDYTQKTWKEWSRASEIQGYQFKGSRLLEVVDYPHEVRKAWESQSVVLSTDEDQTIYAVPLQLRGNTLGVIHLRFDTTDIPDDVTNLINNLSERLSLTLDNAKLFETIQQRAAKEQLIGGITSRMRESLDIKTVLNTAVQEIRNSLDLYDVSVQFEQPVED